MSSRDDVKLTRRNLLRAVPFAATVIPAALWHTSTAHAQKSPQDAVKYQDHPKDGQKCSSCRFFQPPQTGNGPGQCKLVAGEIAPDGWCQLWTRA